MVKVQFSDDTDNLHLKWHTSRDTQLSSKTEKERGKKMIWFTQAQWGTDKIM